MNLGDVRSVGSYFTVDWSVDDMNQRFSKGTTESRFPHIGHEIGQFIFHILCRRICCHKYEAHRNRFLHKSGIIFGGGIENGWGKVDYPYNTHTAVIICSVCRFLKYHTTQQFLTHHCTHFSHSFPPSPATPESTHYCWHHHYHCWFRQPTRLQWWRGTGHLGSVVLPHWCHGWFRLECLHCWLRKQSRPQSCRQWHHHYHCW